MTKPLTTAQIVRRLKKVYGPSRVPRELDPLGELIFTILSQSTSDANSLPAYERLVERFADWDAVRRARVSSIVAAIRRAGLANQKAPRIKQVLARLHQEQGRATLDHLDAMSDAEAREYLTSFEGVGPKTAACVLLFACGRPVLPVDTHVHRVARRLGLIDERTTADAAHDLLQRQVSDRNVLDFHVLLIKHGRTTCKAPRPRCAECVLLTDCPAGRGRLARGEVQPVDDVAARPAAAGTPHTPPKRRKP